MKEVTVKCSCPTCGDIKTNIDNIILRLLEGNQDVDGQYRFLCPSCKTIVLKDAPPRTIQLLANAGARKENYSLPLELLERPREDLAEPISLDDLIDLNAWLVSLEGDE